MGNTSPESFAAPVVSLEEAMLLVTSWKKEGKRIVALSGSFDIFHAGHIAFLNEARAQGDILIVFLNTDASIRMYKGAHRPVVPEAERAVLVANVRAVDLVVPFSEPTPLSLISALAPDVCVNGSERGEYCAERVELDKYGGKLHIVSKNNLSSSKLIERIIASQNNCAKAAVFLRTNLFNSSSEALALLTKCHDAGFCVVVLCETIDDETRVQRACAQTAFTLITLLVSSYSNVAQSDFLPSIDFYVFAAKHNISLDKSWMVTDKEGDIRDGRLTNMNTIFVGVQKMFEQYQAYLSEESLVNALQRIIA